MPSIMNDKCGEMTIYVYTYVLYRKYSTGPPARATSALLTNYVCGQVR